jgi:signal transduction histidine kinase
MTRRSLRFRLLAAAAVSIGLALFAAGQGLVALFSMHVERQLNVKLETYINELIGRIEPDGQGGIKLSQQLSDPRFEEPLSGLYWQIQDDDHRELIRSRSLWDVMLSLPKDLLSLGVAHRHELPGPDGQSLLVREHQVIVFPETDRRRLRIAAAIDRSDLLQARANFSRDLLPYLGLLGVILMIATWLQVRTGLSPLHNIRRGVLAVNSGQTERLQDEFPDEVQPLVDEINLLLNERDKTVENARAWTADLAHGLKTPLSALSTDVQQLRARGEREIADNLEELALRMRQRVDRELIRARLRSEVGVRPQQSDLGTVVDSLVRTLRRAPTGEKLDWRVDIPPQSRVALSSADLTELLGNLLDNAAKWARSTVAIRVEKGKCWQLVIEDDGPGVPESQRHHLGQRGLRLDEQVAGTGLGLAIVRDIVNAYDCSIDFRQAPLGGLAVVVELPDIPA